jgi:hypothetical protein
MSLIRAGAAPPMDMIRLCDDQSVRASNFSVTPGRVLLLAALAGGMGWGIRGQYGHETGAMIAGLLVGLVLVLWFCPRFNALQGARAVALMAIGVSFGGSMTYGQTIGLTQDGALIGNWAALRWGLLGLFIKGAVWIGFAGVFLGIGLSGKRYRPIELGLLGLGLLLLLFLGLHWINEPFDPARKILPRFYFSADWQWTPEVELRPRRERWGGLLVALIGLLVYVGWARRDRLSVNLGLWGMLGGGLGFSLGQCVQAFHAWNLEMFQGGWLGRLDPLLNWWNFMEITFGAIWGCVLALGLWWNRRHIGEPVSVAAEWRPAVEWMLVAIYLPALFIWQFFSVPALDAVADHAITMGLIPLVAVMGGRFWPYLLALPIVVLPIAGKTFRELGLGDSPSAMGLGLSLYLFVPLVGTTWLALRFAQPARQLEPAKRYLKSALLLSTWLYFALNFAFFRYPWPWEPPTVRTPSVIIFTICAVGLTWGVLGSRMRGRLLNGH